MVPTLQALQVIKRDGSREPVDVQKILKAITRCAEGIPEVDCQRVALTTIGGIQDGITTLELDKQSIATAVSLIPEGRQYSKLASRMLTEVIRKEVVSQGILSFSQSVMSGNQLGLINSKTAAFVEAHARKFDMAIQDEFNDRFEYFGLQNFYDHYLLRHPFSGKAIETVQYLLFRVAVARTKTAKAAIGLYKELASSDLAALGKDWFLDGTTRAGVSIDSKETEAVVPYRPLKAGMGQAVAERTILRKKENGEWENWGDVANRVAHGNSLLASTPDHPSVSEYNILRRHIANGNTLMSGRHLQHGDSDQPRRNQEIFTNCSTTAASFISFYLLLNGSGVGRCYDDDMMLVNWDYAPNIRCVLDISHPDYDWATHECLRDAKHKYGTGSNVTWFTVPDSREGWAKALEMWEVAAYEKTQVNSLFIFDFSQVRAKGQPIGGMQGRPASGPVPMMNAMLRAASLKGAGLPVWKQNIYVDHYFAECVLVGGARRSARMSTKKWSDKTVLEFITVKRPIEYQGLTPDEVTEYRKANSKFGFLWSSNNSVTVDDEFWAYLEKKDTESEMGKHAHQVFDLLCDAAYADGTGEPGIINSHKLVQKNEGWAELMGGDFVGSQKYQINDDTHVLLNKLAKCAKRKKHNMIVNPCGEICLSVLGGYCVIADVVPFHCATLDEAEDCFRAVTRALIRVNLMDSLYKKEVSRTNRIGVGMTGVHEFAWKFFGLGFRDLIDEEKSKPFWLTLARFNRAVADEAKSYSKELGVKVPHTITTVKPSGSVSKLFGLTEGWHLPAMAYYLRWVQFRADDSLVVQYKNNNYPVKDLTTYTGTTIVGFPTAPTITELGMGDALVTAAEATPEEQFKWLMLGEKYWIHGTDETGVPLKESYGNQISYTLKYLPDAVDLAHFKEMILVYQRQVRCCSVMPQEKQSSYEYLPEEPITRIEYEHIKSQLEQSPLKKAYVPEDIGREHIICDNGACPVDFKDRAA